MASSSKVKKASLLCRLLLFGYEAERRDQYLFSLGEHIFISNMGGKQLPPISTTIFFYSMIGAESIVMSGQRKVCTLCGASTVVTMGLPCSIYKTFKSLFLISRDIYKVEKNNSFRK